MACVTKKPDEQVFVGVEKQELPDEFSGKADKTGTSDTITQETSGTESEEVAEDSSSTIVVVDEGSSQDVVIVLEDSEAQNETVVVETESTVPAVPETNLITIRSTDAERLGIIFTDIFALINYESMLEFAHSQDISQIVVYCVSGNQSVYNDLFKKLTDVETNFYLLFTDSIMFYNNRELIKNNSSIKGVIFWYEYWNFIQYKYASRAQAFENYLKQLNIVSTTAKQYGLMCYSVVDWVTLEELQKIMEIPLQGLLLAVDDPRIGIEEYIDTNLQLIRMTGLAVYWGILLNYKPQAMVNLKADNDIIKLMKLYNDDPRFQGIIFLY